MPVASSDALLGVGFAAQAATLMGAETSTLAGVGTSQTGAATIKSHSTELTTTGGNTAFVLPTPVSTNLGGVNEPFLVFNSASTSALVFVPSGHTLNGSSNGSLTVAQNKGAMLWQYKPKFWASILSA